MKTQLTSITAIVLSATGALQALIHDPFGCSNIGFSTSVEYLYWKTQEGALYPAILALQDVENGVNIMDIELLNQKFDYTSGVRATLGYTLPCMCYDVALAWTYIRPDTRVSFSSPNPHNFIAISFLDQTNSDVSHAGSITSHWNLNFNMLDLELARQITFGRWFTMRPYIGLKGGWIYQSQRMVVDDIELGQSPVIELVEGKVDRINNFKGIGPRVGVDLRYALASEFGIFGTISGALVYGKFDIKTTSFLTDTLNGDGDPGNGPQLTTLGKPEYDMSPTVQILLGADWAQSFNQFYWFRIGVAYEVQYWWDQMKANNSIPQTLSAGAPTKGDLMIHGLTVQATFEF